MRIAVAGGTGVVGRRVTEVLRARGHEPVVLSRGTGVDLHAGTGLAEALSGADAVIDVSNVKAARASAAVAWFETTTRNLLAAAAQAGTQHLVALSIVGIDRVGLGYYQGKLRQEQVLLAPDAPVPVSVLRATQFHEFVRDVLARLRGPLAVVPRMQAQPIAAQEVAVALADLVAGAAVGRAPDLAGPRPESVADMVRRYLRARGSRRPVLQVPMPGAAGRALRSGGLLPSGPGPRGVQTFDEWLRGPDGAAAGG
jgi:uncharacterized protein YbjT (DUF2867 family)